jgi:transposase
MILRRERLYSSNIGRWRRQREEAIHAGLSERKRGPKVDAVARENRRLREQVVRLEERLRAAEALTEAQGKAFSLPWRGRSCQWGGVSSFPCAA